jgi:hypothetical protein
MDSNLLNIFKFKLKTNSTCRWRPSAVSAEVNVGYGAVFDGAVILSIVLQASVFRNLKIIALNYRYKAIVFFYTYKGCGKVVCFQNSLKDHVD